MKLTAYALTAVSCLLLFTIILAIFQYNKIQKLNDDLMEAEVAYELISQNLADQNKRIEEANKKLSLYEEKLLKNEQDYNKTLINLQGQIKQVKTCEEGMNYLKSMLKGLQ